MENEGSDLERKFAGLAVTDASINSDGLFQVMKAVEAAEATIKQQVEENYHLRAELQKKIEELENYDKLRQLNFQNHPSVDQQDSSDTGPDEAYQLSLGLQKHTDRARNMDDNFGYNVASTTVLQTDSLQNNLGTRLHERNSQSGTANGMIKMLNVGQSGPDSTGFSQFFSPSLTSLSPSRYQLGLGDRQLNLSQHNLMPIADVNNVNGVKQDLVLKIREHEEEILLLRKHLAEYSVKEAQIRNEKSILEKRIAYMRMAFDQQQQELVDAASKAISYRQDVIEENIRLTYALQASQQERSTFVSSLMPLLAEYSLQPPVADAQSIVSNVKILFRHLQEKLLDTETKLKESQYELSPYTNTSNFVPSPSHSYGMKAGLEMVPQPTYSAQKMHNSSDKDWNLLGHQSVIGVDGANGLEPYDLGRCSPKMSRNTASLNASTQLAFGQDDVHSKRSSEELKNKHVTFSDLIRGSEMDDTEIERQPNDQEPSADWPSKNPSHVPHLDDPSSMYSPYLPPVLEEPSSSFSEAADDDPLPAIEGLQISGEAYPGRELQACGYSINGTTSCNFEWVRHLEDGSFNYIDGAKQPNYLVTADDVDTYLAIEVQPLDNRKRKGELVEVFANEHRKITCDPQMHAYIEKTLYSGHASYKVALSTGYLDIWEPAILGIKRDGYSIKCHGHSGVAVAEKFSPSITVSIPYGSQVEFSIIDGQGVEHLLKTENSITDISCSRDAIVLTMRLFMLRAGEKRKGQRKRVLFFNK